MSLNFRGCNGSGMMKQDVSIILFLIFAVFQDCRISLVITHFHQMKFYTTFYKAYLKSLANNI